MENICKELGLSNKNVFPTTSPDLFTVVVHSSWLKQWLKNVQVDNSLNNVDFTIEPGENVPYPWRKVFIKVLTKKVSKVLPLPRYKLNETAPESPLTFPQVLQYVSQTNQRTLWKESYKKYCQNNENKESTIVNLIEHDQLLLEVVLRLYGCNIVKLKHDGNPLEYKEAPKPSKYETHVNLLSALFTLESTSAFYIIYRGHYDNNLLDCLNFSPALIDKNYARGLFLVYQLLNATKGMSDRGLSLGKIELQDIYLSENLWLQIVPPMMNNIHTLDPSLVCEHNHRLTGQTNRVQTKAGASKDDHWRTTTVQLEKLCNLWVRGWISNLDYLLHLNRLAGRSPTEPQAHYMVPWVTDFTSRCGKNWRDLTKSKYRLNKGDRQLTMTYDVTCPDQTPHHVADPLSDITVYVYLARRTPKEVLCKHVRNKWVGAEYPSSIQRVQQWTPDECIPQFYTDPAVFKSIHEDLPDLAVPVWASCAEDFITRHREALESGHVSDNLHHWIDITFGYKLSGSAAIKAKNVCLSLVDNHEILRRGGAVQLFRAAHPPRASRTPPPAPPRLRWTTVTDKKLEKQESSDELSDDEESSSLPQHMSRLNVPRVRSQHKSSRARSLSKAQRHVDDNTIAQDRPERASSHSSHYRVQKSELGKGIIYLPKEFNPVVSIQALESLHNFRTKSFYSKADDNQRHKENVSTLNLYPIQQDSEDAKTQGPDDTAFTNHIFQATYDQNYLKKFNQDALDLKDRRKLNNRYTTDATVYKQFVTESRRQDMLVIGCLIVEIFLHKYMRPLRAHSSFFERYNNCRTVVKYNFNAFPKCVSYITCLLLNIQPPSLSFKSELSLKNEVPKNELSKTKEDPMKKIIITDKGFPTPTPAQLLQPLLMQHLIPFPQTFNTLYKLVSTLHEYELTSNELNILYMYECDGVNCEKYQNIDKTKHYFALRIAEGKIEACAMHLDVLLNQIQGQFDMLDLFLPHYIELLKNKDTSILAAWYLFDTVSKALGPNETRKKLLKHILNLYEDDDFVSDKENKTDSSNISLTGRQKFIKLYHNIFLLQLMVRLGLQCFLDNFTQHLVEAVGGYKDLTSETTSPGHSCHNRAMANKKPRYSDDNINTLLIERERSSDIFSPDTSYESEQVITPVDKTVSDASKEKDSDNRSENELFHFETDKDIPSRSSRSKSPAGSIDSSTSNPQDVTSPISSDFSPMSAKFLSPIKTDINIPLKLQESIVEPQGPSERVMSPTIDIPISKTKTMFTSYLHFADDDEKEVEMRSESRSRQVKSLDIRETSMPGPSRSLKEELYSPKETADCKISDMSSESLIWLAHRLGPVLTCRHITRNLLKMLTLCYIGKENLEPYDGGDKDEFDEIAIVNSRVVGDRNAVKVIRCLTAIVEMYGEQVVLFQYLPHMAELIASCRKRLSAPLEGGAVASLQLVTRLLPYLADATLMQHLQDTLVKSIFQPALRLSASTCVGGPGAPGRRALARKLLVALHAAATRIGPEMTRRHLKVPLQRFFLAFDKATGKIENWPKQEEGIDKSSEQESSESKSEGFLEICRDGTTAEWTVQDGRVVRADLPDVACSPPDCSRLRDSATRAAQEKLLLTFDCKLAYRAHSAFEQFVGKQPRHYERPLSPNSTLQAQYDIKDLIPPLQAQEELLQTFDCELAYRAHSAFEQFVGSDAMARCLSNPDTIKDLCREYRAKYQASFPFLSTPDKRTVESRKPIDISPVKPDSPMEQVSNSFGSNVTLVGNRISINDTCAQGSGFDVVACNDNGTRSNRHLRGDWLIYWEHEIGRADKDTRFNLKQIKLQTFVGHTHSVKSIHCLDNEANFMTGSKDKTVKLWSLRNQGDGNATTQCNWTYTGHKKGVLSLTFLESLRLAVSTDSVVHIWDPFMETVVSQLDSMKCGVSIVRALPGSTAIVCATTDHVIRLIDARDPKASQDLKLPASSTSVVRCICVSADGRWLAAGLGGGLLCALDARASSPLRVWRAHEHEVLRVAAVDSARVVSSGLDQVTALWRVSDGQLLAHFKGNVEPVHCLSVYYNELISGTTNNRISVHTSLDQEASYSSTKLRTDTFKGLLTCMSVLPLNRLLLLGSDNGTISLLC